MQGVEDFLLLAMVGLGVGVEVEVGWVKWLRVEGGEGGVRDFLLNYGAGVGGGGQPGAAIGPVRLQQRDKTWREEREEREERRSEASATSPTSPTSAASSSSGGGNKDGRGRNLSCPHVTFVHFPIFSTSSQLLLNMGSTSNPISSYNINS